MTGLQILIVVACLLCTEVTEPTGNPIGNEGLAALCSATHTPAEVRVGGRRAAITVLAASIGQQFRFHSATQDAITTPPQGVIKWNLYDGSISNLDEVQQYLRDLAAAPTTTWLLKAMLLGPSMAGKSSLLDALIAWSNPANRDLDEEGFQAPLSGRRTADRTFGVEMRWCSYAGSPESDA